MSAFYVSLGGKKVGPFESSQLRRMAKAGEISPSTLVTKEGISKWVKAGTIPGLFGTVPVPPDKGILGENAQHPAAKTSFQESSGEDNANDSSLSDLASLATTRSRTIAGRRVALRARPLSRKPGGAGKTILVCSIIFGIIAIGFLVIWGLKLGVTNVANTASDAVKYSVKLRGAADRPPTLVYEPPDKRTPPGFSGEELAAIRSAAVDPDAFLRLWKEMLTAAEAEEAKASAPSLEEQAQFIAILHEITLLLNSRVDALGVSFGVTQRFTSSASEEDLQARTKHLTQVESQCISRFAKKWESNYNSELSDLEDKLKRHQVAKEDLAQIKELWRRLLDEVTKLDIRARPFDQPMYESPITKDWDRLAKRVDALRSRISAEVRE